MSEDEMMRNSARSERRAHHHVDAKEGTIKKKGNSPKSTLCERVPASTQLVHDPGDLLTRKVDLVEHSQEDILMDTLVPFHDLAGHLDVKQMKDGRSVDE